MLKVYIIVLWVYNAVYPVSPEDTIEELISRHRRSLPSPSDAQLCLDTHNELRASVGDDGEEPIPANMRFMTWDEGLAYTSLTYAKKCFWGHSSLGERRTPDLNKINGENLWAGGGELRENFTPVRGMKIWFNEYKDYDFYKMTCVPGKKCGHYTQMAWAKTYKLGCAWYVCPILKFPYPQADVANAMYMVCMYAPGGNRPGKHLYEVGPRCSKCATLDTCPNDTLCHNATRDAIIPFRGKSGATAGVLVGVMMIAAIISAVGFYVYFYHQAKALKFVGLIRKSRRVSSAVNIIESDGKITTNQENNDNGQQLTAEQGKGEEKKTKGTKPSSVQVEPVIVPD